MSKKDPDWTFANRIDLGPNYGTWMSNQDYREHVAGNPAAKRFWREVAVEFATEHPLEFVDANRRAEQ